MRHTDTNAPPRLLRITVSLVVALMVWIGGSFPASSQPDPVDDVFTSSYPTASSIGVWDQGSDEELCFEVPTVLDFYQVACTEGSTVKQVTNLGPGGSNIGEMRSFQGDFFFSATDDAVGWEVFKYDGTSVTQVTNLEPASGSAYPEDFVVYDGDLYFSARGAEGRQVYRYTGTNVERVTTIGGTDVEAREMLVHDGELYFVAQSPSAIFSFNGTALDRKDIIRRDGTDPLISDLESYNGNLFFSADAGNGNGRQLNRYDGSTYTELYVATPDGDDRSPTGLTAYDGDLYYAANTTDGRELFRYSSGTPSSERQVTRFDTQESAPENITGYGSKIYFSAEDGVNGRELYSLGTGSLYYPDRIDLRPGSKDSDPGDLTVHDGNLYFEATVGEENSERGVLHRYDGSSFTRVRGTNNFAVDGRGTFDSEKVVYDGHVYFVRDSPAVGQELFRSDGTTVELVEDLQVGTEGSSIGGLVVYDGDLYFRASTSSTGSELYRYDGSSVSVAADVISGSEGASPYDLTLYNGFIYFSAENASQDRELYRFSPDTGAQLVENVSSVGSAFGPFQFHNEFQVYDGDLYFVAWTDASGVELFRTSGLSATQVTDVNSGSAGSYPGALTVYDGVLYFAAANGSDGQELYGYSASSDAVRQIDALNASGDGLSRFDEMAVYDGDLYFVGDDGSAGDELFRYDGFSVSLVRDIASGGVDSDPRDFAVYNSRLYFTASTPDRGREPYSFDGQTMRSNEVVAGPVSGGGIEPVVFDDGTGPRLFVTATDNVTGFELYAFTESDGPLPVELTQFDAAMGEESVNLTWATASETANAGFNVQRQPVDGTSWTDVGFVEGSGTTNQPNDYRFEDDDLPFAVDAFQYRLRQVDSDGTAHLSDAVTVSRSAAGQAELRQTYPNPAAGRVNVKLTVPAETENARLELFDLLGRTVKTVATGLDVGRQKHEFEVSDLAPGVYFLRLSAAGTTTTQKLTVVR